jgi:Cd2+/Zn2+-exporting ATPase
MIVRTSPIINHPIIDASFDFQASLKVYHHDNSFLEGTGELDSHRLCLIRILERISMPRSTSNIRLHITGMDCAECARTLEHGLARLDGVEEVTINFSTATLHARGQIGEASLVARIRALGYDAARPEPSTHQTPPASKGILGFFDYIRGDRQRRLALIAALLLLASLLAGSIVPSSALWLVGAVQIAVIVLSGYPIATRGIRALTLARQVTIDLLMTIATLGALAIGETGEAATVILLFALGEALEGYTAERARDSLKSLLALAPMQATVQRPCIDCQEHLGQDGYVGGPCPQCGLHGVTVPVGEVVVGDHVLVRPGERIPVDGTILSGTSAINQAPITGESIPVQKAAGDAIFAGTINGAAAIEIETTRVANDSTVSRIVRLVEQAQAQRAPIERFVDQFARWYTPAVVLLALLVATIPPMLLGAPFLDTLDGTHGWLYRALALLIVACPCALVISTPVTLVSTLSALAQRGVLVKGGAYLDALARVRLFAFDKTGTLTEGKPTIVDTRTPACQPGQVVCDACDDMLALAAAVESRSEHPLAHAVMAEVASRGLTHRYAPAEAVQSLAGRGVQGTIDGSTVTVGSHTLLHEPADQCNGLHPLVEAAEAGGQTVMLIRRDDSLMGFVSVADVPRPETGDALRALKKIDRGVRTAMLTGDNLIVAQAVAEHIGEIDEVVAGLMPEEKLMAIQDLQSRYGAAAMIGDGVNDAPALAAAAVGIAMGGTGTAQAMETADVILMQDDLARLPEAVSASRGARGIIQQNIAFSLGIKAAFLLLTLFGAATLWMAVFADMGASLLVTFNGMRMLRKVGHARPLRVGSPGDE